jgi:hypothetical protein
MQIAFMEHLASILNTSPAKAMIAGALFAILPALVEVVWIQLRRERESNAAVPSQDHTPDAERELTCVICGSKVAMSAFATHVAAHDAIWQDKSA